MQHNNTVRKDNFPLDSSKVLKNYGFRNKRLDIDLLIYLQASGI